MTKHAYQQSVFSGSDTVAVAPFAQITVTNASDDSAASIWDDADGTTPIADGVLLADENGYFIFYADEGTYNIAILSDGISKTLENVEIGAGNPYSGVFKGSWDMSSGSSGPAAPLNDYQATHTATTVTPSATLGGTGPRYLAASSSPLIPLLSSGIASATITQPAYAAGDTIYATVLLITSSSVTASDIESLFSGLRPSGLYLAYIALSPYAAAAGLGSVNDGTPSSESGASAAASTVVHATLDYATGVVSAAVGSGPVFGTTNLDLAAIAAKGDGLRLWAGVISTAAAVVFDAGHISVNFSDTSGGGTGFQFAIDATEPVGALDNDWYEVSTGGYFHGKTTRAGQFVKLIRGKTDLIVVDKPADPGTSTVEAVTVTHFSDINTTGMTDPRLYVVTADETNANQRTQYLFDGSALMWLVALEA